MTIYDEFIAALCLWREARGASIAAKTAIWWVLQNRANDLRKRWPTSIHGVVTQPHQFSSFNANDPNVTAWPNERQLGDWEAWLDCLAVVSAPIGGDPTLGATNYHSIPDGQPVPAWASADRLTVEIGPFKFYKW